MFVLLVLVLVLGLGGFGLNWTGLVHIVSHIPYSKKRRTEWESEWECILGVLFLGLTYHAMSHHFGVIIIIIFFFFFFFFKKKKGYKDARFEILSLVLSTPVFSFKK